MNSFFHLINTTQLFSSFLAAARKMMVWPESGGRSLPSPLARTPMLNSSDNLPSYPPDNHHSSGDV